MAAPIRLEPEAYHKLITSVFKRDSYKCRCCGWRSNCTAHHVVYRSQQGSDVLSNMVTLCFNCHRKHHDGKLKIYVVKILESDIIVKFKNIDRRKKLRFSDIEGIVIDNEQK